MSVERNLVLDEIVTERLRQAQLHGDAHDDNLLRREWATILSSIVNRIDDNYARPNELRTRLIQLAAVALAAIEAIDRNAQNTAKQ